MGALFTTKVKIVYGPSAQQMSGEAGEKKPSCTNRHRRKVGAEIKGLYGTLLVR